MPSRRQHRSRPHYKSQFSMSRGEFDGLPLSMTLSLTMWTEATIGEADRHSPKRRIPARFQNTICWNCAIGSGRTDRRQLI